jgi:hypothetical protein
MGARARARAAPGDVDTPSRSSGLTGPMASTICPCRSSNRGIAASGRSPDVEIQRWEVTALDLPSQDAVRDYLIGQGGTMLRGALGADREDRAYGDEAGALAFARTRDQAGNPLEQLLALQGEARLMPVLRWRAHGTLSAGTTASPSWAPS